MRTDDEIKLVADIHAECFRTGSNTACVQSLELRQFTPRRFCKERDVASVEAPSRRDTHLVQFLIRSILTYPWVATLIQIS